MSDSNLGTQTVPIVTHPELGISVLQSSAKIRDQTEAWLEALFTGSELIVVSASVWCTALFAVSDSLQPTGAERPIFNTIMISFLLS